MQILKKGELQVGEKERGHVLEQLKAEIALQISSLCVNPESNRPYPPSMIQKALDEIGFSIRTEKSAKSQALKAIRELQDGAVIKLQRAKMRLRITTSGGAKEGKRLRDKLGEMKGLGEILEEDISEKDYELVATRDCPCVLVLMVDCLGGSWQVPGYSGDCGYGDERLWTS
jgi:ribosome maturation protein SDO1